MKKGNLVFAVIVSALVIAIGCIAVSFAEGTGAGTSADPVVTKSYVDKQISELKASMETSSSSAAVSQPSATWETVFVEAGKSLIGSQGTEIIVRSGKTTAIDNGVNGLSDLTAGTEPKSGDAVVNNHLLLVPRSDGRGLKVLEDAWIMILGSYEIKAE